MAYEGRKKGCMGIAGFDVSRAKTNLPKASMEPRIDPHNRRGALFSLRIGSRGGLCAAARAVSRAQILT